MIRPSYLSALFVAAASAGCYENFGKAQILTSAGGVAECRIAVDGSDRIHLLYAQGAQLYAQTSTDRGLSWSVAWLDSAAPGGERRVVAAADRGRPDDLYSFYWVDDPAIRLARSTDGGGTWETAEVIASGADSARGLCLAQSGVDDALLLGFEADGSAFAMRSDDFGATWEAPVEIHRGNDPSMRLWKLEITADGASHALLSDALPDSSASTFFVATSTDGGLSWPAPDPIYAPKSGEQAGDGDLLVLADGLHAAFSTRLGPSASVNHASRIGEDWEVESVILENTQSVVADLRLTTTPLGLPVLVSYRLGANVYYQVWDGALWTEPERLNNAWNRVPAHYGGMGALSDGAMGATWGDDRLQTAGLADLAFALSDPNDELDFGVTLIDSTLASSVAPGDSLSFDFEVGNWTPTASTVDVWIEYGGAGRRSGVLSKAKVFVGPGETAVFDYTRVVPAGIATGIWDLTVYVGIFPALEYDSDMFSVDVRGGAS